jgi:hypothetical protein
MGARTLPEPSLYWRDFTNRFAVVQRACKVFNLDVVPLRLTSRFIGDAGAAWILNEQCFSILPLELSQARVVVRP